LTTDLGDVGEAALPGGPGQTELRRSLRLGEFPIGRGIREQRELLGCGALVAGGGGGHALH
ncbi:hypothetical protein, partial [Marinobacter sp.]|uniref:hypothetical protein n=1 Tax=Marinobacter sp. TaxID=50741 RepID=UPI0032992AB7